jgi:integrase
MGRGRQGSGVEVHGGKIRIRFTFNGKRCMEALDLKATSPNIKAAVRIASEVRQKIALGVFDYAASFPNSKNIKVTASQPITLEQYAPKWLGTLAKAKSTKKGYQNAINNFWVEKLGKKALAEIRHTDCATVIANKVEEGTSGKTINNLLIPARRLFKAAVADRLIDRSPLAEIENLSHQQPEIDPFTRQEMVSILAHHETHYPEVVWNYYQFAFATGVRPSEQIALRWGDVDWNERTIKVCRALVLGDEKATKTNRIRHVDLTNFAIDVLMRQKAHTFMRGPNHWIFCTPERTPWPNEKRQRLRFFQPTLRALGIRERVPYNTRHTFATINLMAGINPNYIASQLGHTTTAMLFQRYARWIPGADDGRSAAQMNAAFEASETDQPARIGPKLAQNDDG